MQESKKESDSVGQPLVIGIDVGGTNTDAVLLQGSSFILASAKVPSSLDVSTGVKDAIRALFESTEKENFLSQVKAVLLGTTAFVNALLEGRGLARVAVVRLCGPSTRSLPPFVDFPPSLRDVISAGTWFADGGLRFDGSPDCIVSKTELQQISAEIAKLGTVDAVVVSGTFSPADQSQEQYAAQILREALPLSIPVSISVDSGQLGLLARENSAILNATLVPTAQRAARQARYALWEAGIPSNVHLFFTANDGSVVSFAKAAQSPLRCIACGPTNSLRGAALLLDMEHVNEEMDVDCIVLDVGGTSTDAGCLVNGRHPRETNAEARIGGVRCNYGQTDVVSIALGGGSIVSDDGTNIGPESVGADISFKALCFGGNVCTATCIAVAMIGSECPIQVPCRDYPVPPFATTAWDGMQKRFYELIEKTRTNNRPVQVVVVGGGAILVDVKRLSEKLGCLVVKPEHGPVANACGSALAQAVGEAEMIADLSSNRETTLTKLKAKAQASAGLGAKIIQCEEVPLAYLPGKMTRIFVRALAPLDLSKLEDTWPFLQVQEQKGTPVDSTLERPRALRQADPPDVEPSPPNISNGIWTISEYDAHCLAIGCGILGCGGGGSTFHGLLQLLSALREGHSIRVVSAKRIPSNSLVAPCGFMGAPSVTLETIGGADQLVAAVRQNVERSSAGVKLAFITLSEVGGSNGIMPLLVAGAMDLPVVDADLMGRAFPELQMTTTSIYGLPQTPMTVSDSFGRCVTIQESKCSDSGLVPADSSHFAERVLRPVCVEFGCSAGLADPVLTAADLCRIGILGSLTRARRIGDCILRGDEHPAEAIDSMLQSEGGKCIFQGMVSDVQRETTAGFARGSLTITSEDRLCELKIEFQNEFLIARRNDSSSTEVEGCVPDIISLVDVETARPIATEEVRFGFRVCVILLPVPNLLRTEDALKVVGPSSFGIQEPYESVLYGAGMGSQQELFSSFADLSSR